MAVRYFCNGESRYTGDNGAGGEIQRIAVNLPRARGRIYARAYRGARESVLFSVAPPLPFSDRDRVMGRRMAHRMTRARVTGDALG